MTLNARYALPMMISWLVAIAGSARAEDPAGSISSTDSTAIEIILTAWDQRERTVKSFHCQYQMKQTLVNIKEWGAPLFPGDDDGEESDARVARSQAGLQKCISLSLFDGKTAYRESGDEWSHFFEARQSVRKTIIFDGVYRISLLEYPARTSGTIRDVDEMPVNYVHQSGLWLGYAPERWLKQVRRFDRKRTTVRQGVVIREGQDCHVLTFHSPSRRSTSALYVNPSRGYLPVQLITKHDGVLSSARTIRYAPDEDIGWRVTSWTTRNYNRAGKEKETMYFKVQRSYINGAHPIDEYMIEFPDGAEFVERVGGRKKFFEAKAGGNRRFLGSPKVVNNPYSREPMEFGEK